MGFYSNKSLKTYAKMARIKCESCGFEENAYEGVLEEFLEIELYKGLKQRQYSYQSLEYNKIIFKKL